MAWFGLALDLAGILTIVLGACYAFIHDPLQRSPGANRHRELRHAIGRVGVLAFIVLIRTFLSFSLELEIEGRFPWQKVTTERL